MTPHGFAVSASAAFVRSEHIALNVGHLLSAPRSAFLSGCSYVDSLPTVTLVIAFLVLLVVVSAVDLARGGWR